MDLTSTNELFSIPLPLALGSKKQVVVIFAGRPRDQTGKPKESYQTAVQECTDQMVCYSTSTNFHGDYRHTSRNLGGASLHYGVSHGFGRSRPGPMKPYPHTEMVEHLQSLNCFQSVAGYGDSKAPYYILHKVISC
jgi:hypothetical protein